MQPIGFIHVQCAEPYFGTADILGRVARFSDGLSSSDLAEIEEQCRSSVAARVTLT